MQRPQKSVLRAYTYLFLLGYVGGHRFYMKKPGSALFMIFLFLAGAGLVAAGYALDETDYLYGGLACWALVASVMLVDLVMIPGMIEDLNDTGEDRKWAAMTGNLDPSFQATLRQAGRAEDLDAPRKSALPDDYKRPWKQGKSDAETYHLGED